MPRVSKARLAVLMTILSVCLFAGPVFAAAPACKGRNLLGELASEQPDLYAAIGAKAAKTINSQARLWRIEADGARAASYLLGTIHLSDERTATIAGDLKSVLDTVDTVALEITGAGDKQAMQAELAKQPQLIMLPADTSLWDLLDADNHQSIVDALAPLGLTKTHATRLQPWLPALMLSISACQSNRMAQGHKGLDQAIEAYASGRGTTLVGLETATEQFSVMSSMPLESQVLFLTDAARTRASIDDLHETMIQLYVDRRINWFLPFTQMTAQGESDADRSAAETGFMVALIDKRNVKMAERARPLLDAGNALIAVGALHLVGDTGLVNLLRQGGFTVTPVE